MSRGKKRYKEVIRDKVISLRLSEEEFLRLRANALRNRTSMSRLMRDRIGELVGA